MSQEDYDTGYYNAIDSVLISLKELRRDYNLMSEALDEIIEELEQELEEFEDNE